MFHRVPARRASAPRPDPRQRPVRPPRVEAMEGRVLLAAVMLADVHPTDNTFNEYVSDFRFFETSSGAVYFHRYSPTIGVEMWKTDGTPEGTAPFADLSPGPASSFARPVAEVDGRLIFATIGGPFQNLLWTTGGTPQDVVPFAPEMGTLPQIFDVLTIGRSVFVSTFDPQGGGLVRLWNVQGADGAPVLMTEYQLTDFAPGGEILNLTDFNGTLLFSAKSDSFGQYLWKSDGTPEGTVRLARIDRDPPPPDPENSPEERIPPREFTVAGDRMFFISDKELWKTDGTADGTVRESAVTGEPWELEPFGGNTVWVSRGRDVPELLLTDGTAAGTRVVSSFWSYAAPGGLRRFNGELYFYGPSADGQGGIIYWKSDGTPAGTRPLLDWTGATLWPQEFSAPGDMVYDGMLYLVVHRESTGTELWRTDGTPAGTGIVADIRPGSGADSGSAPQYLMATDDGLFFLANDGTHGLEPWRYANNPPLPAPEPRIEDEVLYVTGTTGADTIRIDRPSDDVLLVEINGQRFEFDPNRVEDFAVDTLGSDDLAANDRLEIGPNLRANVASVNFGTSASGRPHTFAITRDSAITDFSVGPEGVSAGGATWAVTGPTRVELRTSNSDDRFTASGPTPHVLDVEIWADGGNDSFQAHGTGYPVAFHGGEGDDTAAVFVGAAPSVVRFDGGAGNDGIVHFESGGLFVGQGGVYDAVGNRVLAANVENLRVGATDLARPTYIADGGRPFELIIVDQGDFEGPHHVTFEAAYDDAVNDVTVSPRLVTGLGATLRFARPAQHLTVNTGGGDDTVTVTPPSPDSAEHFARLGIGLGNGRDTVRLGDATAPAYWHTEYFIDGGGDSNDDAPDELVLDETARGGAPVTYVMEYDRVVRSRSDDLGAAIIFGSVERVTLEDGAAPSTFVVTPNYEVGYRVRGNDPPAGSEPGDVLRVVDLAGNVELDPGAVGAGVFYSPDTRRVEYTGIERAEEVAAPTRVWDRHVFYNNSAFDDRKPAAGAADFAAVATDKRALLPGEFWSLANVTSYTKGINGVIVQFAGATPGSLTSDDFVVRLGQDAATGVWEEPGPAPTVTALPPAEGPDGGARYALTWPDGAIRNTGVRVLVKANDRTGLAYPDVFCFANLVGESAHGAWQTSAVVNALDIAATRRGMTARPVGLTNDFDHNKDGRVNALDLVAVRQSASRQASLPGVPGPAWAITPEGGIPQWPGAPAAATQSVLGSAPKDRLF